MNSLLLAPYNESMQLGQGYNSFLQRPCVYGAVHVDTDHIVVKRAVDNTGVAQVVSYSSRVVTKISEVTRTMNISAGSSIKSGSITVAGNQSGFDEAKFVSSDLNIVISVKVINQTSILDENSEFGKTVVLDPAKPRRTKEQLQDLFHHVYGDSYISGFIQGGEFHSVVSIRVLDSTQKETIVSNLKSRLTVADPKSFALRTADQSSVFAAEMKQTETSIFVNWSGGGQIKLADEQWTLDSIFRAAAAFPNKVAASPQRCWAILTRYPNNLTFLNSALGELVAIDIPNYTNARQYADDLLDAFVGYRSNLLHIKRVLDDPTAYVLGPGNPPVDVRAEALVNAKESMKTEIDKIMLGIDELHKNPAEAATIIKRQEIKAPEIWATCLPTLRRTRKSGATGGLAPPSAQVINTINLFAFANENARAAAENLFRQMSTERPANSKPPPATTLATTADALSAMTESEKNFVNLPENRRKYAAKYKYDTPCGAPGKEMNFNDVATIESSTVQVEWPKSLTIHMVFWGENITLGLCQLRYETLFLSHPDTQNATTIPEGHTFRLDPSHRIQKVKIGYRELQNKEHEITFIQVTVHNVAKAREEESKLLGEEYAGDTIVESTVPEGFVGLKGFYGHAEEGSRIARIGVIWGK